jgi:hypothetical protein
MMSFLEELGLAVFPLAVVVSFFAWFRAMRTKTRAAYWKGIAVVVAAALALLTLLKGAGLMPDPPSPPPDMPDFQTVIGRMPPVQVALIGVAAALWIGGGNLLMHFHRRLGKQWWQMLNPAKLPFKDFNAREWLIFVERLAASLGVAAVAVSVGRPS